ncbi:hypothetical protein HYFRA_00012722 [Hymenoscyphus fraxineus]|uniref:Cytochrome P450 n=1 Tax=Hymenoscyphus fraxineus TaxID=746836 RepID=A0A9N9L6W2_9HELO|nr:hypothetical protein HYFRA_00012722 [Hymenoscyphus fraxineus]
MPSISVLCAGVLTLVSSFYLLTWTLKEIRYRAAARKAGCSPPLRYWHYDPILGLDLFIQRVKDMNAGDSIATDRNIVKRYGRTVLTNAWGIKQYVTSDPANMQTVLATQVDKFGSAPMNRPMCRPFLGDGLFTTDGQAWKHSRQMINPLFARSQVSELSSFEKHLDKMIAKIPKDGSTVDLQPLCKMLFLDSSTEFIFGKSANSLSPETHDPIARELPALFDQALTDMFTRYILGRFGFLAVSKKKWLGTCADVHKIIDGFIDEEIEAQAKSGNSDAPSGPYNELMNIFFPARDTAAILTSSVFFMLARNPKVWDKLRAEVLGIGSEELTFELLKSMKYLQAVMNETLRIHSPAGGSWKTCLAPSILPHGGGSSGNDPILLETGDQVRMSFAPLHLDREIWGPDVLEFRPERWDGLKHSWNFVPFMGGRRICPAQQNVLTDVGCIIVRIMQRFKACENRDECFEYIDKIVFTRESRNGVKVGLIPV